MRKTRWAGFLISHLILLGCFILPEKTWAAQIQDVPPSEGKNYFYNDPYQIRLTPGDDSWFLYENKTTAQNLREISLAIDPANGPKAQAVQAHLANGGRLVILVGGYGSWGSPSAWERPIITYVNDFLNAVVLQVNYQDSFSNWYIHSFKKGVDRVTQLVLKARRAGAGKIRIYGHSQGSDITARVVAIMASPLGTPVHQRNFFSWWEGQGNPDWFEGGFGFGNPAGLGVLGITVTSYAAPPPDERGRRGGFYRYEGKYNGFYYGRKLVLFNRVSDPATYGGITDAVQLGTSAHNYRGVFSYPGFLPAFEAALDPNRTPANTFDPAYGDGAYVDRSAGERFDFTDVHFIPFIPSAGEVPHFTLTVANVAGNNPLVQEVSQVLVSFYDPSGRHHHDEWIDLPENGSFDIMNPMPDTGGSAIVFATEEIAVVINYAFEGDSRYFAAAYPSEAYPSRTLYIPFLAKGWVYGQYDWRQTTEMVLFNPGSDTANAGVTYYNATPGRESAQRTVYYSIPARGSLRLQSTDLPGEWRSPSGWGTLASGVVRSNKPLSAVVRNRIGSVGLYTGTVYRQHSESNYRVFTTRGQDKVYAPLLTTGQNNSESALVVQNTGEQEVTFTVRYYLADQGFLTSSPQQILPPWSMKVLTPPRSLTEGSAVVQVDSPINMGKVALVSQVISLTGAELHEGIPQGVYWYQKRPDVVDLPFIRDQRWQQNAVWNGEVNVVNMGTSQEEVFIRFHDQDGRTSYTSIHQQVSPDGSANFSRTGEMPDYIPPNLFAGSGKVEGSRQKRLGAAVHITRGNVGAHQADLLGYGAWW